MPFTSWLMGLGPVIVALVATTISVRACTWRRTPAHGAVTFVAVVLATCAVVVLVQTAITGSSSSSLPHAVIAVVFVIAVVQWVLARRDGARGRTRRVADRHTFRVR